ncbi:MAG: hypothetical protein K6U87_06115 [Firmicutes bacterium]|nr:hypothetical protein [Bacillota bacterium]
MPTYQCLYTLQVGVYVEAVDEDEAEDLAVAELYRLSFSPDMVVDVEIERVSGGRGR